MATPGLPPAWHVAAIVWIALGVLSALILAVAVARRPPKMAIMRAVWPISGLYGGPLWLGFYWLAGREPKGDEERAMPVATALAASHCGAGCTLGDLVAEWLAFLVPAMAVAFGYRWLFGQEMVAVWVLDFLLAYAIGLVFQYYTIAPMRGLGFREVLWAAIKADTLSIIAWQVGMYGFMALAQFGWAIPRFGAPIPVDSVDFWFLMQLAMLCGFATAFPVNWILIRTGIKERM